MNPTIAFTVTIPIKNSDAANLKEAFSKIPKEVLV